MAAFMLNDAYVSIGGNVLSTYVTSVSVNAEVEELDDTAMGDTWRSKIAGLKTGTITVEFNQDVAAGLLDAIMWPLLGTSAAFEIRPTSSAVSTSNPKFTGSVIVTQWAPLGNSVGELAKVSVTFPVAGAITRATA